MQAVRDMVQNKRHRLIIGMDDLRNHNLDLARRCAAAAFPRSLLDRAFLLLRWASSSLPD
jgi:hypothetical protein